MWIGTPHSQISPYFGLHVLQYNLDIPSGYDVWKGGNWTEYQRWALLVMFVPDSQHFWATMFAFFAQTERIAEWTAAAATEEQVGCLSLVVFWIHCRLSAARICNVRSGDNTSAARVLPWSC